jgi:hypothetical protein
MEDYTLYTRKDLIEECNKRVDENGIGHISNCNGRTNDDIIQQLIEDDILHSSFIENESHCDNEAILQGGFVNEEKRLIYYNDGERTYCFGIGDLSFLVNNPSKKNPYTQLPLNQEFLDWIYKFLETDIYKEWLSEFETEDVKEEVKEKILLNNKRTIIDNILHQGLYVTDKPYKRITDPYIYFDHFFDLINTHSEYSLLPKEIDIKSYESVINYMYNNRDMFVPHKYSLIYMLVKYAYDKEIIDNKKESDENKDIAEYYNENIENLIGKLYPINVITEKIFREIKQNHKLAEKHTDLFMKAVERGRKDILEIMKPYLKNKIVKQNNNEAIRIAAQYGRVNVLKMFKKWGFTTSDAKIKNNNGDTPLLLAAEYGHVNVLKFLKEWGFNTSDAKKKNKDGHTSLILAAMNGHVNVLKELRENWKLTTKDAREKNKDGDTALMFAAYEGHVNVLKELRKNWGLDNTDAKIKNKYGDTAITLTKYKVNINILNEFINEWNISKEELRKLIYDVSS